MTPAEVGTDRCGYCGLPLGRAGRAAEGSPYCCLGCEWADALRRESATAAGLERTLIRLAIAIFCTLFVVVFSMALWAPVVYGPSNTTAGSPELARSFADLFRHLGLLGSLPVLWLLGGPLFGRSWLMLRARILSTDVLLAGGVLAAFVYSAVSVFRGAGHVYFEVGCTVLVFVTLGRWLEATGRLATTAALDNLDRLLPLEVELVTEAGPRRAATAEVVAGDRLLVAAGQRFPVDGRLEQGSALVDEQVLTGESQPVLKQPGDRVLGGALNLDGTLVVRAEVAAGEGTLSRLIEAVRFARQSKGRYERLADGVAAVFIPLVSLIAISAGLWHGLHDGLDQGLMVALAVVLIACPCALGLATPMAVWAAMGRAAESQILFRHGEALERLARVRALRIDKTGTLTTGTPRVARVALNPEVDPALVAAQTQRLVRGSHHAFAGALARWLPLDHPVSAALASDEIRTIPGQGLLAAASDRWPAASLGNRRLVEIQGLEFGPLDEAASAAAAAGQSFSCLGWDGRVQAVFVFQEELRPDAAALVDWCRREGLELAILTGDHAARAAALAAELGLPVEAELLPEDKLRAIERARQEHGPVAMIGDGINDAPALAAADVGIALGCGTDVSRESAQVCLLGSELARAAEACELARQTVRVVRQNLAWSFGYNSLGIALAATGWLNPAVAAGLMVASSVLVITNSLRLRGSSSARPAPAGDASAAPREERGLVAPSVI